MEFKAKPRDTRKIKVTFPNGEEKEFAIVDRTIGSQREMIRILAKLSKTDETDPLESFKSLDNALSFIFPGKSLKDFESLDLDDLYELIISIKASFVGEERTEDEKKNQSNEPTLTNS
jgi:hypothetical protein